MRNEISQIFELTTFADTLRRLVDLVRPESGQEPWERFDTFILTLEHDQELVERVRKVSRTFLSRTRMVHSLAESGILPHRSFWEGLTSRLGERALPTPRKPDDLRGVLRLVLEPDDWKWIAEIDHGRWVRLIDYLVDDEDHLGHPHDDIDAAIQGLAQRVGALGIDEEINARIVEVEDYDSPFLDLTLAAHAFLEDHRVGRGSEETYQALMFAMEDCREIVRRLRSRRSEWGTSIRMTSISRRLSQQLDRLELLAHIVRPEDHEEFVDTLAMLVVELITTEQTQNHIGRYIRENLDLLAYQITEETAAKGQKYVAESAKKYWKFLRAALTGGAIVAFFAIAKLWLAKQGLPLAVEALAFSMNYAICFVLIYVTGSILATKQPAVTASAIARLIDTSESDEEALESVADMVVLVWRSQFISFVGNLVAALPIAALVIQVLDLYGMNFVDGGKAAYLFESVDPSRSGALFYAAVAGVFLFGSGVIAGAANNRFRYIGLEERLGLSLRRLGRLGAGITSYVKKHLGMVVGNVTLGFALGTTGTVGVLLGLPLDIRHIAFSSANVGIGSVSAPELLSPSVIIWSTIGVLGIGFVNFLVSFGLTLFMTLESRNVSLAQDGRLLAVLLSRAAKAPLSWFYPIAGEDAPAEPETSKQPAE